METSLKNEVYGNRHVAKMIKQPQVLSSFLLILKQSDIKVEKRFIHRNANFISKVYKRLKAEETAKDQFYDWP